jgi:hypothetical protein
VNSAHSLGVSSRSDLDAGLPRLTSAVSLEVLSRSLTSALTKPNHLARLQNPGHLHLNRHSVQLSPRTPPAMVSRERRAALDSPPSSPATPPSTLPLRRALPIPALVQSSSGPSVFLWQTRYFRYLLYFLPFARSSTLLPLFFVPASFIFNRLRTLLRKYRGWGIPDDSAGHPGWHTPPGSSRVTDRESQITTLPSFLPATSHKPPVTSR